MRLLSNANQKLTELQNESNRLQRENQEFVIAALGKRFLAYFGRYYFLVLIDL